MPFTKEELADRKNYLGASDAAAAIGLSRWRTPLGLWAEKCGEVEPADLSENLAVELGNELEDFVARKFCKKAGKKVHRVNEAFVHPKYDFLRCHIDRKVDGEDAILECKTAGAYKGKEWAEDQIPVEYLIQCYHMMACSGYKKAYIAVVIGNSEFQWKEINYEEETINKLIKQEVDFWENFVVKKVMPITITAKDDDVLAALFPTALVGSKVELGDEVNALIEQLEAAGQDSKAAEAVYKKLRNELKVLIKENEQGETSLYTIKWTNVFKPAYTSPETQYRLLKYYKKEDKKDGKTK